MAIMGWAGRVQYGDKHAALKSRVLSCHAHANMSTTREGVLMALSDPEHSRRLHYLELPDRGGQAAPCTGGTMYISYT